MAAVIGNGAQRRRKRASAAWQHGGNSMENESINIGRKKSESEQLGGR